MEYSTELEKTAYLRELEVKNQCELAFFLNVNLNNIGLLQEEVRAVRQITDNVDSLLKHIINKIKNLIKTHLKSAVDDMDVNVALRRSSQPLSPKMVLKDLIKSNTNGLQFQIFDQFYLVVINAPFVREIKLPAVVYANYSVQASKLYCLFSENNVCQYSWYKSKDKENWTLVANSAKYNVKEEDVGFYLKLVCVPCNSVLTGPAAEAISENKVEMMGELPKCPFEERHLSTSEKLKGNCFRFVSYNILSKRYAETNESFPYCSPKFLAIDYRKQLIAKELLGYNADIICLQEVDNSVYTTYYRDSLKSRGFMSFYHRKGNKSSEGLACFFDTSRFKKIDDHQIIYSNEVAKKFPHIWKFVKVNPELKDCFMRQMTSLHITILKLKSPKTNSILIVGNTHLFYHPEAELVRLIQINIATCHLNYLSKQYTQKYKDGTVRVILCGDFNSVPTSAVYQFLTQGKINKTHSIFHNSKNNIDLFHNFQLESSCGVPKYTNYTDDFKDCLDYIFIEKNKIKVNAVIPLPEKKLECYEGLPNDVYPSDHLALVVDLELL